MLLPSHAHHPLATRIQNQCGFINMVILVLVVEHIVQLPYRCQIWNVGIYHNSCNIHGCHESYVATKITP